MIASITFTSIWSSLNLILSGTGGMFHLNCLRRLNRDTNSNIDVSKFDVKNRFIANSAVDKCSYIEAWLEALDECTFDIGKSLKKGKEN